MDDNAAKFVGDIPRHYDGGLGPVIFVDYAADMAEHVAPLKPTRVLETAAGTGIVTRALRDRLHSGSHVTATDLNADMLEIAKRKFRTGEAVSFQPADALALPFADESFDAMVCQFGVMFYPDKEKGYREALRVLAPGGRYFFSIWDSHRHNPFARITHELVTELLPDDPPQFMNVPFSNRFEPIKEALVDAGFVDITAARPAAPEDDGGRAAVRARHRLWQPALRPAQGAGRRRSRGGRGGASFAVQHGVRQPGLDAAAGDHLRGAEALDQPALLLRRGDE